MEEKGRRAGTNLPIFIEIRFREGETAATI